MFWKIKTLWNSKKIKNFKINNFLNKIVLYSSLGLFGLFMSIILSRNILFIKGSINKYRFFSISSSSMEPNIREGSIIVVNQAICSRSLKVGDIITYRNPRKKDIYITHRISCVLKKGNKINFITKGDKSKFNDEFPISILDVIGKYENIKLLNGGYFLDYIKTKKAFIYFGSISLAILIVSQIGFNVFRELFLYVKEKCMLIK